MSFICLSFSFQAHLLMVLSSKRDFTVSDLS